MNRFPMSIDLTGKTVFLIGNGPQIRDKQEKLAPFGAVMLQKDSFTEADAASFPALVIVGDSEPQEAERIADLCRQRNIPVNVVDQPALCSFYFPALITRGALTVSVSTGGSSPAAAAYLRQKIEEMLPVETEQILVWLCQNRKTLKEKNVLRAATAAAFSANRPLTEDEISEFVHLSQT